MVPADSVEPPIVTVPPPALTVTSPAVPVPLAVAVDFVRVTVVPPVRLMLPALTVSADGPAAFSMTSAPTTASADTLLAACSVAPASVSVPCVAVTLTAALPEVSEEPDTSTKLPPPETVTLPPVPLAVSDEPCVVPPESTTAVMLMLPGSLTETLPLEAVTDDPAIVSEPPALRLTAPALELSEEPEATYWTTRSPPALTPRPDAADTAESVTVRPAPELSAADAEDVSDELVSVSAPLALIVRFAQPLVDGHHAGGVELLGVSAPPVLNVEFVIVIAPGPLRYIEKPVETLNALNVSVPVLPWNTRCWMAPLSMV